MSIRSGSQLKAARALLGLTQEDVAAAAGLHPNSIGYIERQKRVTTGHSSRIVEEALNTLGVVFSIVPTLRVRIKGDREFGI
jgi:transcriptional regulator with XRE-family HTH domain